MAGLTQSVVIDQSEIDKIPSDVKEKVESFITTKLSEIESLKSKHEKLRVNSEQQYFDLEKQLISCNGNFESEKSQREKLQEKLSDIESKYSETSKKLLELQEKRDTFATSELDYLSSIQHLENEKRDLTILSNKRNKEIEQLNGEISELQKKVSATNVEKCEAQARLGEQQSEQVSREFREKRLEKEKEQLEKQIEWFNQQLTEKTNLLSSVRTEKTNKLLSVQSQLDEKTEELVHLQAIVESMKKSAEEQAKRTESLIEKLKDERENQAQLEEQFRQELAVHKRLIDLFKASSEDNDAKVVELTGAVEELRNLLKVASSSYSELENSKTEEVNRLGAVINEKESSIANLEQELKTANDLLLALKKGTMTLTEEAVESLSPSAAATSKLLKSGMSLTQIYNEYVQATDALREEREENKRLNSYMEQILQEIEEKAPLLKKQREDYETALNNLDQMSSQLDTAMLECEKLRADADDMRRRFSHVQRECSRHQQSAGDLGRQVQHLLKEVEELRGGRVVRDDLDVSSNNISSSSDIISENLVTFRTIEEMQKQNQHLIQVARDLTEKKEQEENEITSQKTRELKDQLEFAMTELNNLKEARARQAEMVESIVRQRDMYRVLLHQDGTSPEIPHVSPVTSTPLPANEERRSMFPVSPGVHKKQLEEAKAALSELRTEFSAYKKEKAENDKIQSETSEKLRQTLSEQRVANAKLSTQLESATERYKIVQGNAEGFKKEINLLQDRNHQSSATILKHESAVAHLKEELMTAKENVARWQVQVDNLRKEKELISNAERRLAMEMESLRREQTSQALLMNSLQAIQNNQERAEHEFNTRHKNQVEGLERELANMRRKLETSLEDKTKQATAWEDIVKNVHLEIKMEKEKQAALQTKAENAAIELDSKKAELKSYESKLAAAEQKLEKLSQPADDEPSSMVETEAMKDLKNQRALDQVLIKNLRQEVEAGKKHANQFKTISEGLENSLKEQAKTMKDVRDECEKKIADAAVAKEVLANKLEQLDKFYQEVQKENNRLSNEGQAMYGDLRQQLVSVRTELEEAISQKDAALASCKAAQEECKKQADIAVEAQSKYERELMLHAADVEASAAVKKQADDMNEHLQQSQEETILYEKQLSDSKASWAEQERIYKQEVKVLETRVEELTNQNVLLHEQMSKLSSQVVEIQQAAQNSGSAANTSFSEEEGKSSNQLLEVIRFLRREKEIAESKLAVVQTECNRVKQRFGHLEKRVAESEQALQEERQRIQTNVESTANQVELMRKVSNLNVLTDSNKLLRDERDQLLNVKQQLEAKVQRLETDIEPLQENLRETQSQKDIVTIERDTLKEEVNRWKNRTSNLIEQSHKTDPEEQKRQQQEKENLRKMLAQAREESAKQKAEISRANISNTSLTNEVTSLKQESTKTGQELTTVKKQVEDKTKECEDKTMTITRLKQIGRKYKEQAEKITKELDEVKKKAAAQETGKINMASLQQTVNELTNTVAANRTTISSLESQLADAQNSIAATEKRAEQATAEVLSVKESFTTKEQENTQLQEDNTRLRAEVDGFETRREEFEKKQTQSRAVLQNARNKMMHQKASIEKLESENKQLKELQNKDTPEHVKLLRTQYESRISSLENDLEETKKTASTEKEKSQTENAELLSKVQQLQKQLESAQHKHSPPQQPVPARPAGSVAPSSTSNEPPKTANIKPMASSASSSRQAPSMAAHSSTSSAKVTASIRPMAISPTAATNLPNTPTATVMPTTVSQHDSTPVNEALQQTALPSTAAASGRVQIVEPQVAGEWNTDTSSMDNRSADEPVEAMVTPAIGEATQVVPPTLASAAPTQVTPIQPAQSTSSSMAGEGQHTLGVALGKRTREEETFGQDEGDSKRTRITAQEQHAIPTINVIDENQQVITQIQPHMASSSSSSSSSASSSTPLTARTGVATPSTAAAITRGGAFNVDAGQQQQQQEEEASAYRASEEVSQSTMDKAQRSGDDVIMVLSDEDDSEARRDDNLEEVEEEEYEDDDDEDDDDDDDEDEEIVDGDDNDDVVIIDIDEQQQQPQQQQQQQQGTVEPMAHPTPAAMQAHTERLPSVGRAQQFTPFMLGAGAGVLEDDDCTVPSTPTLSQPRRADGFAEALNSPAVSRQFVFGGVGDGISNPDLAQLESQRALGMDDTRMDLSQFDESGSTSKAATQAIVGDEPMNILEVSGMVETSDMYLQEAGSAANPEDDGEEVLLEGDGDPTEQEEEGVEEEGEHEEHIDTGDAQEDLSKQETSKESSETRADKSDSTAKPPIKKIVWDSPQASTTPSTSSSAQGAQAAVAPTATQQTTQRRAQGLRRGGPTRGRGQYWSQGQARGGQFTQRGRGGFRGF